MGEEIAFEDGRISDFKGLVTLTVTLDRVILHTVMHHSSTSTYTPSRLSSRSKLTKQVKICKHFPIQFIIYSSINQLISNHN